MKLKQLVLAILVFLIFVPVSGMKNSDNPIESTKRTATKRKISILLEVIEKEFERQKKTCSDSCEKKESEKKKKIKLFKCKSRDCKKRFTHKSNAVRHYRCEHLGIKPYKCGYRDCGYATDRSSDLEKHKKSRKHHMIEIPHDSHHI